MAADNGYGSAPVSLAREQFAAALDAVTDGVFVTAADGTYHYANAAAARILGYPSVAAMLNSSSYELARSLAITDAVGSHLAESAWPNRRALREGRLVAMTIGVTPQATGAKRWWEVQSSPVPDALGITDAVVSVLRDVTDRIAAAHRLDERARQLELGAAVGTALASGEPFFQQLQRCAEAMVQYLDAAFARIWTVNEAAAMLELRASAGMYTHLDGGHARVPVGAFKIGRIAASLTPHLTNAVPDDPEVSDHDWARREGMVAFAGYPLLVEGRAVGVMAMFARHPLADATLNILGSVADQIALGIARADLQVREQAALAEARAERARLHDLFMQAPAMIAALSGPDHVFSLANPQYLQFIGARDLIGKPMREAVPEVVDQGFIALLDTVYSTGEPFIGTEIPLRLDRLGTGMLEDAYVDFVYQPTRDGSGAVDGIFVHVVDVTEQVQARQHAEELLRDVGEAERRYRKLFEGVREGILVINADGQYIDANPAMLALVGYSLEELREMRVGALTPDEDSAFAREIHALPETSGLGQIGLRRKDGTTIPVEGSTTSIDLPSGRIHLGTWRDITDRLRAEEERQQFIAMVAHELRNPLASLIGYTQLMQRRERYDAKAIETVIAQARRLERLTHDLRETVLMASGVPSLATTPVDVRALVMAAVEQAQMLARDHTITLEIPPQMPEATWDADRVAQVLGNVLVNAIRYSPAGSTVYMQAIDAGNAARISVTDHGIGIPAEAVPHLFEPFYRATNAKDGSARGMGLGLSISKALVEAHGGEMHVESAVGQGSTFTIVLPYHSPLID